MVAGVRPRRTSEKRNLAVKVRGQHILNSPIDCTIFSAEVEATHSRAWLVSPLSTVDEIVAGGAVAIGFSVKDAHNNSKGVRCAHLKKTKHFQESMFWWYFVFSF